MLVAAISAVVLLTAVRIFGLQIHLLTLTSGKEKVTVQAVESSALWVWNSLHFAMVASWIILSLGYIWTQQRWPASASARILASIGVVILLSILAGAVGQFCYGMTQAAFFR